MVLMVAITNKEHHVYHEYHEYHGYDQAHAQHLWSFTGEGSRNDGSLIMAIMTEMEGTANMIMSMFSVIRDYFKNLV